jgi:hypothetical protein
MDVASADDLNVDRHHVWVGAAPDDPVANWLSGYSHGRDPASTDFGANRYHVNTHGHSGYWDPKSESLLNQGRIIAGKYELVSVDHVSSEPDHWSDPLWRQPRPYW